MSGSATFTTVMSSSSMKIATATAIRVHHLRSTKTSLRSPRGRTGCGRPVWSRRAPFPTATRRAPFSCVRPSAPDPGCGALYEGSARPQVAREEGHDRPPQRVRGPVPVGRPVVGEEGVTGALVQVHFHLLPALTGTPPQLLPDLGRGIRIFSSDRGQQRAAQPLGKLERRRGG